MFGKKGRPPCAQVSRNSLEDIRRMTKKIGILRVPTNLGTTGTQYFPKKFSSLKTLNFDTFKLNTRVKNEIFNLNVPKLKFLDIVSEKRYIQFEHTKI